MRAQRKQPVLEPKGDYVWGTHQPLPQPRTIAFIEISSQSKQVVHQELDRAALARSSCRRNENYANSRMVGQIQRPDGTKLKIKNVLSAIFSHGVRWELVERNPVCGQGGSPSHRVASTGVRQSNRVSIRRVALAPDVVRQTLERLPLREATVALVDAVTALRASELIALKWKNVGWGTGILQSEFALVDGKLKETKSRNNPLPLAESVLQVLRLWRENTAYRSDEDWILPVRIIMARLHTPIKFSSVVTSVP
jgi:integrase